MINETLAPLAIGAEHLRDRAHLGNDVRADASYGDRKNLLEAIACVDCAVWDLVGKALGKSVCQLLGGYRSQLPIISIGGYYVEGKTLADFGREMESYREAGMAGCKFKVGGSRPRRTPSACGGAQGRRRRLHPRGRRQPGLERAGRGQASRA